MLLVSGCHGLRRLPSKCSSALRLVLGENAEARGDRRRAARASADRACVGAAQHELVYGELGVGALAKILDAVGVSDGDAFLDIGSGDGEVAFAAAMMYPREFRVVRGIEIVPDLYDRSVSFLADLRQALGGDADVSPIELLCGDVHGDDAVIQRALQDTSLAICFATTWSRNEPGRRLPRLSSALAAHLQRGSRVVVIDGYLCNDDGYEYEGELRIECPDTAPFSVAHLYVRR